MSFTGMSGGSPTTSYRRVCELASGGMGEVELAIREEGRFRRLYAVKRLREGYRNDVEFREMFLEEARIAGLLRHPNAVSVLDVGEDARGPFLVMDYIEGTSVFDIITRSRDGGAEVPLQIALRIAMDAAQGLHAAHELRDARGRPLGLVHRDVSPQNLLVGFDGVTRVTDFGIAKALGRTTHTATGVLKGKFGYLAPEQLRFDEPDRRSDIFSLGVVLFELLSGQRLYKNRDGMDGARRILNEPPPDIGEHRDDVPPELVALLFSMLAKDPAHRPPDALAVARALEPVVAALVELEGRAEVSDYVAAAFAAERIEKEERVARALANATGAITHLAAVGHADSSDDDDTRRRPRRTAILALSLLVALLVAGGATVFALGDQTPDPEPFENASPSDPASASAPASDSESASASDSDSDSDPASASASAPASDSASASAPASDSESASDSASAPESESASDSASDSASESESESASASASASESASASPAASDSASASASAPRPTKRRPPRRRSMRATATPSNSSVPMWDWQ